MQEHIAILALPNFCNRTTSMVVYHFKQNNKVSYFYFKREKSMKIVQSVSTYVFNIALLVSLIVLAGCRDWFTTTPKTTPETTATKKAVEDGSPVVVTLKGEPAITEQQFNTYLNQVIRAQLGPEAESNPEQIKSMEAMFKMMPQLKRNLLDNMVNEVVLGRWVVDKKIDQTPEYKEDYQQYVEMIRRALPVQAFNKYTDKNLKVDAAEAEKYYSATRTSDPAFQVRPFLKTSAGIIASGISFNTEKEANEFLKAAQAPGADFAQVAKKNNKTVVDFGVVNLQNPRVEPAVAMELTTLKDVPSVRLIKSGDKFWVVHAAKRQEAEFAPYSEVKEAVNSAYLMKRKSEELENIKKEYDVEVSYEFLEKDKADAAGTGIDEDALDLDTDAQANQLPTTTTLPEGTQGA